MKINRFRRALIDDFFGDLEKSELASNCFCAGSFLATLLAVGYLAGVFWAVLLLGLMLFYLGWVAHNEAESVQTHEERSKELVDTAVNEALHAARLDHEALIGAVRDVVARGVDEIRTETRRAELRPVV